MGMNKDHTVEELLAEIADSAAREADLRNRAEVAEAKLAEVWNEGFQARTLMAYGLAGPTRNPYIEVPS